MDLGALRQKVHALYAEEREALGPVGLHQLLKRGEDWQLALVLAAGVTRE